MSVLIFVLRSLSFRGRDPWELPLYISFGSSYSDVHLLLVRVAAKTLESNEDVHLLPSVYVEVLML